MVHLHILVKTMTSSGFDYMDQHPASAHSFPECHPCGANAMPPKYISPPKHAEHARYCLKARPRELVDQNPTCLTSDRCLATSSTHLVKLLLYGSPSGEQGAVLGFEYMDRRPASEVLPRTKLNFSGNWSQSRARKALTIWIDVRRARIKLNLSGPSTVAEPNPGLKVVFSPEIPRRFGNSEPRTALQGRRPDFQDRKPAEPMTRSWYEGEPTESGVKFQVVRFDLKMSSKFPSTGQSKRLFWPAESNLALENELRTNECARTVRTRGREMRARKCDSGTTSVALTCTRSDSALSDAGTPRGWLLHRRRVRRRLGGFILE
ncbi:hypothetical protein ARMGADRAFT_1041059 [Armillaria gallica]|uniref:Uncharacterized protein n=1 Tax=Armillaria gallica TaxID=47427 RepID=A0A2H3CCM0_ARMGA|nr:hypothetical protein ARMGADRAFT_1041059 [Armillaria gallica]